jgi:signal peptidase I
MTETGADSFRKALRDYGGAVLAAVFVALLIRFFVVEAYLIPSSSMKPTLLPGDTIFVKKFPFGLKIPSMTRKLTHGRAPKYGEIVVFSPPNDPARDYIKRVVALSGDTVEVAHGHLLLNGKDTTTEMGKSSTCGLEKQGDVEHGVCWEPPVLANYGPEKVPEGYVFLLGDLRSQTPETRKPVGWGMIPVSALEASAAVVWLSIEPPSLGSPDTSLFSRIRFDRIMHEIR